MAYTARTIAQIQAQIIVNKGLQTSLSGLTSTSKAAYWYLFTYITAVAISLLEQIWAILVNEIETDVSKAVPGTINWIQARVIDFQAGNVIQLNTDFTLSYPDPQLPLIITSAAVTAGSTGALSVKVAKGGTTPTALSGGEITELTSYLSAILPAGQIPQIISSAADTLQVNAIVYYNGQYNSVISANVIAALNTYMTLLPFNGLVKVSDIEKTILGVTGVVDVTISQITITPTIGSVANLILASTLVARSYQTYSGYLTNAANPNDFPTTITFQVAAQ